MDKTTLELAASFLGFAGLFAAVAEFKAPQLRLAFLGENPFLAKRDAIQKFSVPMFIGLSGAGVLLQAAVRIWGAGLPDRSLSPDQYAVMSAFGLVAVYLAVRVLGWLAGLLAHRHWHPAAFDARREFVDRAVFAIQHEWLDSQNFTEKSKFSDAQLADAAARNREYIEAQLPG